MNDEHTGHSSSDMIGARSVAVGLNLPGTNSLFHEHITGCAWRGMGILIYYYGLFTPELIETDF